MGLFKSILLTTALLSTALIPIFGTNEPPKIMGNFEPQNTNSNLTDVYFDAIERALEIVYESQRTELFSIGETTLYDVYSDKELELLFRVVEAEATDYDVMCKSHVASVIFNRLEEGWWGGDLIKSLMYKRQFEVITNGRYKKVKVTDETVLACEIAFKHDTAQGALFFDSTKGKSWAHENCEYLFKDDAHWFYK